MSRALLWGMGCIPNYKRHQGAFNKAETKVIKIIGDIYS